MLLFLLLLFGLLLLLFLNSFLLLSFDYGTDVIDHLSLLCIVDKSYRS